MAKKPKQAPDTPPIELAASRQWELTVTQLAGVALGEGTRPHGAVLARGPGEAGPWTLARGVTARELANALENPESCEPLPCAE